MKRRAWLTVGAVVLGGAGVVTIAVANPSDPPKKPHQQERAAKLRTLQLDKGGATERELPATGTDPFSLVGIGWDSATVEVKGTAQVRTRNAETGKWSGWQALELDAHRPDGAEATAHGASEPLWVGPSTGVQVRVDSGKALPKNLKLHMVDPGVSSAEAKNPAATVMDNAAFAVDETPSASPGDPVTPTSSASPTDTAAPTDSATPTSSPTDTAEPTAAPTVTPSPTPTPTDSTATPPVSLCSVTSRAIPPPQSLPESRPRPLCSRPPVSPPGSSASTAATRRPRSRSRPRATPAGGPRASRPR